MSGFKAQAGFVDAATWTTAWATVTTAIPMVSESLTTEYERLRSMALVNQAAEHVSEQGIQMVTGDLVTELDYNNHGLLLYGLGAFGGGVYTLAADLDYFHLEIDRVFRRFRFNNCMVNTVTISAAGGDTEPVKVTFNITARLAEDTATAFPSISLSTPNRAYWDHIGSTGALAIAAGTTMTTSHARDVSSFEAVIANGLRTDGRDTSSNTAIIEPERSAFRKVTAKFGFARYAADGEVFRGYKTADTAIQWSVAFVDGAESVTITAPECKIVEGANFNVSGPGPVESDVAMECHFNNNSVSAVVDQIQIAVV